MRTGCRVRGAPCTCAKWEWAVSFLRWVSPPLARSVWWRAISCCISNRCRRTSPGGRPWPAFPPRCCWFPGAGLLLPATAKRSALILTAFIALWVVALQLPHALAHPLVEGNWLGVGEDSSMVGGGWLIYCAVAGRNDGSVRIARILFGIALVPIGLSHFVYLQGAATLIPSWMPWRVPLTALGGAGHIAAGLAIVIRRGAAAGGNVGSDHGKPLHAHLLGERRGRHARPVARTG